MPPTRRTSPKIPLNYKGSFYDPVPSDDLVQSRAAMYVLAADPPADIKQKDVGAQGLINVLKSKLKDFASLSQLSKLEYIRIQSDLVRRAKESFTSLLGEDYQKYREAPAATPVSEEAPGAADVKDVEDPTDVPDAETELQLYIDAVKEKFKPFVQSLYADASGVLAGFGISYKQDGVQLSAVEADGVDVVADIAVGNKLTAFGGPATITLDYALKFDYFTTEKFVELEQIKAHPLVKDIIRSAPNLDKTKFTLQEVVVQLCEHNFAAQGDAQISDLLGNAISFFQNGGTLRMERGALGAMPVGGVDEAASTENFEKMSQADKEIWLKEKLVAFVENKLNEYVGVQIDPAHKAKQWSDKKKFEQIIDAFLANPGTAPSGVVRADWNIITKYIKSMLPGLSASKFATLMKDALERKVSPGRGVSVPVNVVERAVRELTAHEEYTGKIDVGFSREGYIVATIAAPYKLRYHFKKAGTSVSLLNAMMEFCGHKLVVTDLDDAKKLLTADLALAMAYKRAVNPELSPDSEATDYEKMVRKIFETSLRLKEEQEGTMPSTTSIPSGTSTPKSTPATQPSAS